MVQELFTLLAVFVALFLFGMFIMRAGLYNLGKERFHDVLVKLTDSAWKGLIVGTVITAVFQSSSAVMVMAVGLVATGYLTFRQTIGVILGTNIGSCLTLEIIAFDLSSYILPLLIGGVILLLFPRQLTYCLGCVSFGIACIFIAMNGLESLAEPVASFPFTHSFFTWTNDHYLGGIALGGLMTAIIQSSTGTIAIAMGFIQDQVLSLNSGVAIMLGANIGTCLTAYMASIGAGKSARMVAHAHIWLNIFGVLLFFPLIDFLAHVSSLLAASSSLQLAHASTIFNIICSLLVLPFVRYFAAFVERFHRKN
ncbi:Na/Pi symporter [Shouchella shacheensis]|uniref:Na/Pi symporter n=1 Tax=Shouchella shacheensis TaxID=1649580 RepID=UPI00073FCF39|nr:Na/Pi symporter [Shouchella shacheensis]